MVAFAPLGGCTFTISEAGSSVPWVVMSEVKSSDVLPPNVVDSVEVVMVGGQGATVTIT